jgi:hypothetical protein
MSLKWKTGIVLSVTAALLGGFFLGLTLSQPAQAAGEGKGAGMGSGPRYTVVHTEGTNLIVTDNKTNILYFYTIDHDEKPGADLKLRGSANLNQVGKQTIVPTLHSKKQKKE